MNKEFKEILNDIQKDKRVQKMKGYRHHRHSNTYQHSESVAKLSYKLDKKFNLNADKETLLKGAMLHDFYLYDWHNWEDGYHWFHGFTHPGKAAKNAKRYFDVNDDVYHVIKTHMWPLNPIAIPLSKEAWIVCLADKCVAIKEVLSNKEKE